MTRENIIKAVQNLESLIDVINKEQKEFRKKLQKKPKGKKHVRVLPKQKPKRSVARENTNRVINYNNQVAGGNSATNNKIQNLDIAEYTRRKIVDMRRAKLGKAPKYGGENWWEESDKKTTKEKPSSSVATRRTQGGESGVKSEKVTEKKPRKSNVKAKERNMFASSRPLTEQEKKLNAEQRRTSNYTIGGDQSNQGKGGDKLSKLLTSRNQQRANEEKPDKDFLSRIAGGKKNPKTSAPKKDDDKTDYSKEDFSIGKSIDLIKAYIDELKDVVKRETGFKTRVTGVNLGTKMRHGKDETGKRTVKEVKTGDRYNLQSRIGDAAEKSLYKSFNSLLDAYQHRWYDKSIFDEEVENKGRRKITQGASGKRGTDHRVKPKPFGSKDQKHLTS